MNGVFVRMGRCCTARVRWGNYNVWKLKKNINTQTVLERFKEDNAGEDNISQQQRYHLEVVKLVVLLLLLLAV